MTYSPKQIENAKKKYNSFLKIESISDYNVETIGRNEAEQRIDYNNKIVSDIKSGNKELEKEWKLFFLREEVKADQKESESKAKKAANKEASADVLAPIKEMRKLGEFGKWLNTAGNPFRKQNFNKKYTQDAVNEFLSTI